MNVAGGVTSLPYTYQINGTNNNTNIFSSLNQGNYTIIATDGNGCTTDQNVVMTEPATLVDATYTQSDYNGVGVSCQGDTNGFINVSVQGGVPNYNYSWSNGEVTEDLNSIDAGTYTIIVTDNNGCIDTETITVTEPNTYISSYTQSNYNTYGVSCNGDTNGYIDISVQGGTSPYSFNWNNGATTEDLNSIGAGTYILTSTDVNGCTTNQTVIITEPNPFTSGLLSNNQIICYNTVADTLRTIISPQGGNPPYTYNWEIDSGSGFSSINNNNLDWYYPSNLITTTSFLIKYSDDYQCNIFLDTVTVTVLPEVTPGIISSNQTLCYDSLANDLFFSNTPSGGNNSFIYQWQSKVLGGVWNDVIGQNSVNLTLGNMTESTFYKVKVSSDFNSNCIERYTDSIYIEVYDSLNPGVISSNQTICYNTIPDSIMFTSNPEGAGGNYSFKWYSSTDSINWNVLINQTNNNLSLSPLLETTYYKAEVKSDFGCGEKFSNIIKITVYDEFNSGLISDNDTICLLEDPEIISSSIAASGANGIYNYQWQQRINNSSWNNILNANLDVYQPNGLLDSTDFRLIVSNNLCSVSDTTNIINIIVNPLPVSYSISGDLIVCANQSDVNYTLTTTPNNYRYRWNTNVGNIIGTNQSKNCLIDWPSIPNSTASLEVEVKIFETGCKIITDTLINISSNLAPDKNIIEQMPNTNILVCNDSSLNMSYQWGYTNLTTDSTVMNISDTLRYNQFTNNIDTLTNRYWVITSFNYGANESCSTISYYNPPPNPLIIIEQNNNVLFYPNPVNDILYWDGDQIDDVKIFDINGREIQTHIEYSSKKIDFRNINSGIYLIQYLEKGNINQTKIIVK